MTRRLCFKHWPHWEYSHWLYTSTEKEKKHTKLKKLLKIFFFVKNRKILMFYEWNSKILWAHQYEITMYFIVWNTMRGRFYNMYTINTCALMWLEQSPRLVWGEPREWKPKKEVRLKKGGERSSLLCISEHVYSSLLLILLLLTRRRCIFGSDDSPFHLLCNVLPDGISHRLSGEASFRLLIYSARGCWWIFSRSLQCLEMTNVVAIS